MKTSELTGSALNYAVILGLFPRAFDEKPSISDIVKNYPYSTSWALGGPLIEREKIHTYSYELDDIGAANPGWCSQVFEYNLEQTGPTPLIAAMRCFVASRLGNEVEVPNELIKENTNCR